MHCNSTNKQILFFMVVTVIIILMVFYSVVYSFISEYNFSSKNFGVKIYFDSKFV